LVALTLVDLAGPSGLARRATAPSRDASGSFASRVHPTGALVTTATTAPATGRADSAAQQPSPTSPAPAQPADSAAPPEPAAAARSGGPAARPRAATPSGRPVEAGGTVWLTGLPSAGKTTLARAVAAELAGQGRRVELLDGDLIRETLCADLGFSRADRDRNVGRIGFVAALLAKHGVLVLAPVVSPYAAARDAVRAQHAALGVAFLEVHVATPVVECAARDVKGLYARQRRGELRGLTGVDDPYEPPVAPEVRVDTAGCPVADSAGAILAALVERGLAAL
jgi:adenylylsulfate kinase